MTISKLPENEVCRLSTRVMESEVVERTVPRLRTSFSDENIKMAILSAFQRLGFDRPTAEQEEAGKEFICGREVFVSLPTGSGKSMCFVSLPPVYQHLRQCELTEMECKEPCIVLVLAPLPALMRDQVRKYCTHVKGARS